MVYLLIQTLLDLNFVILQARIKTKNGLLENVVTQLERAKSELKDLQNNIEVCTLKLHIIS